LTNKIISDIIKVRNSYKQEGGFVMDAQIVTMSTKGQIALPISMRRALGLETGAKLMAFSSGDAIVLKAVSLPSADELKSALDAAQSWAAENGYSENDINDIIKSARSEKK